MNGISTTKQNVRKNKHFHAKHEKYTRARARARTHARTHAHTHGIVRIHNANKEHMHARTHTYTRPRGMVGGYVLKTSLKAG